MQRGFPNPHRRGVTDDSALPDAELLLGILLDTITDCDHALARVPKDKRGYRQGIEFIRDRAIASVERHGVASFAEPGEPFDPHRHEAASIEVSSQPDGSIARVLSRGWRHGDRILRIATVIVSQGTTLAVDPKDPAVPTEDERRFL